MPPATGRRPLHPSLTHAPLGGVAVAAVLDVISAVDGGSHPWAREQYRAGTFVLMVATAGMFLAIASGLFDRATATTASTPPRSRTNRHAVIMTIVTAGSMVDLTVRRDNYSGASHTPGPALVLTLAVLGLALVGGELGGRLTHRAGVNVRGRGGAVPSTGATASGP